MDTTEGMHGNIKTRKACGYFVLNWYGWGLELLYGVYVCVMYCDKV